MKTTTAGLVAAALATTLASVPSADATTPAAMRVRVQPIDIGEQPRIHVRIPVPPLPDGATMSEARTTVRVARLGGGYRVERVATWSGEDLRFTTKRVREAGTYQVRVRVGATEHTRGQVKVVRFTVR